MDRDRQKDRMGRKPRNTLEDSQNRVTSWLQQSRQQRGGSNPSNSVQGHSNWGASQSHHYGGSNRNNNAHGYPNWGTSSPQRYGGSNAHGYRNWGQSSPQHYGGSGSNAQGYPNRGPPPQQQREPQSVQRQPMRMTQRPSGPSGTSPQQPHDSNRHVPLIHFGLNPADFTPNRSWTTWTSSHVVHDDGSGPCLCTQWHPQNLFDN